MVADSAQWASMDRELSCLMLNYRESWVVMLELNYPVSEVVKG